MKFSATPKEQLEIVATGAADVISREELLKKLEKSYDTGKPLLIKLGADPSAPDIHLGTRRCIPERGFHRENW